MNGINTYNIAYVVPNQYAFCVIANIEFIIPLNVNGIILKQVKIMYIDVDTISRIILSISLCSFSTEP